MTDKTQPEALRLANEFKLCNEYDSIPSITDIAKAETELRRQHTRIAELEAQIEALSGVQALSAAPARDDRVPEAWTNLLAYVLQDDLHNRLTPRVIDIAYTAFNLAKQPNTEDGGASDWFTDTKPTVDKMIAKLRKDLIEDRAASPTPPALSAAPARPTVEQVEDEVSMGHGAWDMVDPQELIGAVLRLAASPTPPAEQQAITPETGNSVSAQGAAITSESGAVYAELPADRYSKSGNVTDTGWYNIHDMRDFADRTHALRMEQAAPKAAPALPEGWTACTIEFGNDGPEEVAYGPQRMMNRLAKWLGKYFAQVIADAAPKAAPGEPGWWRKRADEIEVQVALTGSPEAMRCYTDMRTLLQAAAESAPQQEAQEPVATVIKKGADRQWMSERLGALPDGIYSLYLAPQPAPAPLSDVSALIAEARENKIRARAFEADAARWRLVETASSDVTLRLHNLRPDQRAQYIDAALAAQGDTP